MSQPALVTRAFAAFASEAAAEPSITLRGGNALDDYKPSPAFDPIVDSISEAYFEEYAWGMAYLDAASWRHCLPHLIAFSIRTMKVGSNVTDAFLNSLRPPDREPPRLSALSAEQQSVITEFLDLLAFSKESAHQDLACQALEEWWAPGALYRAAAE
jgi:hypothetical protein